MRAATSFGSRSQAGNRKNKGVPGLGALDVAKVGGVELHWAAHRSSAEEPAAAGKLSEVNRSSLKSGDLTAEDLQLAAQIESLVTEVRLSALSTIYALGNEPAEPPGQVSSAAPLTDPADPP